MIGKIIRQLSRNRPFQGLALCCLAALAVLAACTSASSPERPGDQDRKLQVVATTTILGDVVKQIGEEAIDLQVLLPSGSDPHTFEPTPKDIAAISSADLVIINGAGLEESLARLLESVLEGAAEKMVSASEGIELRTFEDGHPEEDHGGEEDASAFDPHVWFDPDNVLVWTGNIEQALSAADPANSQIYRANAEAYRAELLELDGWIESQVAQIPPENRKLVTDHQTFGYFADRYGFIQVGAVIPGFSIASAPSAQELAALQENIRSLGARAIFVGSTVNPAIAEQVASDTGVQLVPLYTDSLTGPDGEAGSYLELMRFDVAAIVAALKESDHD
jgi:manganese/iron transport system substrate-binding protein